MSFTAKDLNPRIGTEIGATKEILHRLEPYPADSGRLLSRTTLVEEESLV